MLHVLCAMLGCAALWHPERRAERKRGKRRCACACACGSENREREREENQSDGRTVSKRARREESVTWIGEQLMGSRAGGAQVMYAQTQRARARSFLSLPLSPRLQRGPHEKPRRERKKPAELAAQKLATSQPSHPSTPPQAVSQATFAG
ncbi:hypothetical protein B0T24DRAFT_111091 [Lasiosphaeria ovina]|uniref:Uncharacterized protein n=1 Tax=Lasiosphaeria ovina TaxID=92902 RepID=A0AAE0MZ10_9PEZI|nr:hypothetical protein B0T24DRAFT_111091 [Lasiosphaeria ovina]